MFEFIFNGTGTSNSLPAIQCLTDPNTTCKTCPTTLTPEGKKNIRRNTSGILRKRITEVVDDGNGGKETRERDLVIVIDVGKTFLQAAIEWFPKYGLRKIDAVIITHSHADATNGLDDLRGWTLNSAIQSHLDIYLNVPTFNEIKRAFPYLTSKGLATGGGDVPEFKWHMIEAGVPFSVGGEGGFWITPIEVDHGLQFPTPKSALNVPLDRIHGPLNPDSPGTSTPASISTIQRAASGRTSPSEAPRREPFKCFSFIINNCLTYMSDVSNIPDEQWPTLLQPPTQPVDGSPSVQKERANSQSTGPNYTVFIVDLLRPLPYASHFGVDQTVQAIRKLGATRNYVFGLNHELNHDQWTAVGEAIGQPRENWKQYTDPDVKAALDLVSEGSTAWVRPAFDGLRIEIPEPGDGSDPSQVDGHSE